MIIKRTLEEENTVFERTAPEAVRSGKDFFDYAHRHGISPSYIGRYHELQMQEELRRNPPPTPEQIEREALEKEVSRAMQLD